MNNRLDSKFFSREIALVERRTAAIRIGIATLLWVLVAGTVANAAPLAPGSTITFTGNVVFNAPPPSATSIISFSGVIAGAGTGTYLGVPNGTASAMSPYSFNPFNGPITPLWSFSVGGNTYSFDLSLTNSSSIVETSNSVTMTGSGSAKVVGTTSFDPTAATWSFSSFPGGTDTDSFTNGPGSPSLRFIGTVTILGSSAVPEGSSSSALLFVIGLGALLFSARLQRYW